MTWTRNKPSIGRNRRSHVSEDPVRRESKEPRRLQAGKRFHKKIQSDWARECLDGEVRPEKPARKPGGNRGRIDVHVGGNEEAVAVVEIKATDWDRMAPQAVRRNVRRHARQVWNYIESELADGRQVSPGIVYPKRPRDPALLRLIEALLEEQGIPIVWDDETVEECRERHRK